MKSNTIEVTDSDFEEKVIKQSKKVLVVVDFWAGWCTPCMMLGPVLETIVDEYKGKVILAKLDVDMNPAMSQVFRIDGIPSVKFFRNEKLVDQFVGFAPEAMIRGKIDSNLNKQAD
jgi:putative thioredoxin